VLEIGIVEVGTGKARAIEYTIGKGDIGEIGMDKVDSTVGAHAHINTM